MGEEKKGEEKKVTKLQTFPQGGRCSFTFRFLLRAPPSGTGQPKGEEKSKQTQRPESVSPDDFLFLLAADLISQTQPTYQVGLHWCNIIRKKSLNGKPLASL